MVTHLVATWDTITQSVSHRTSVHPTLLHLPRSENEIDPKLGSSRATEPRLFSAKDGSKKSAETETKK
jgi:hypothetical protein